MNPQQTLPQNPTGINGVGRARKSIPGSYSTGKGTTAQIKAMFREYPFFTAREIGHKLGVPARQVNKRLSELVKSGFLKKGGEISGRIDFTRGDKFTAA